MKKAGHIKSFTERSGYFDRIKPFVNKNLIKAITGQRRVGKNYLMFQLVDEIKKQTPEANIIYINKENFEFDEIENYRDLIHYVNKKISTEKPNYLFVDEIQDISQFEKALRHFLTEENIDIYCTGSNADMLSGELATYLSGRYIELKVYSLSYLEFLKFHKLKNTKNSLNKYLNFGGLPYLKNLPLKEDIVFEYLQNIFTTIIYKDVISRNNIRNTNILENLVRFLANNVGNIISAKKISDYLKSQNLKVSPQIILTYLEHLQSAFLIYKVKRTDITGKKVFEIHEKYYFEDWGLKNSLVGYNKFNINQVLENVVYIHLKIAGYEIMVGQTGDKEIDFICERDGAKLYVQVAYLIPDEKVIEREFGNLLLIKDNFPKIVVSLDEYAPKNIQGIEHIHLKDFLSDKILL